MHVIIPTNDNKSGLFFNVIPFKQPNIPVRLGLFSDKSAIAIRGQVCGRGVRRSGLSEVPRGVRWMLPTSD